MIDHRQRQLDKAHKEGREILMPEATKEQFEQAAREKRIPAHSCWWLAVGVVGPERPKEARQHWSERE